MLHLKNKDIKPIPGNPHMIRLAIITKGLREFWVMLCIGAECKGKCYIEEYVHTTVDWSGDIFGNFKFIQDDREAEDLTRFSEQHKLTDISLRANEMVEIGLGRIVYGGW